MRKLSASPPSSLSRADRLGSATTVSMPNPDDGVVRICVFTSAYFNMSYPLPAGWIEGIPGPGLSISGYYILDNFVPASELAGTVLIAVQDIFFAAKPLDDVMAMAGKFSRSIAQVNGMSIDRLPTEVKIADRRFSSIDFSGVGLFRSVWITRIPCHFVSLSISRFKLDEKTKGNTRTYQPCHATDARLIKNR
jgi:hypothetical protein